jgi:hypothetical protein
VQHSKKENAMNCTHRMWDDPGGPLCTRTDTHDADASGGHVYEARDGSFTNASESIDGMD